MKTYPNLCLAAVLASASVGVFEIPAAPLAAAPVVISPTSASIGSTYATLGGNVTADGGDTITERGVVYAVTSTNSSPQIGGSGVTKLTVIGTTGIFSGSTVGRVYLLKKGKL